MFKQSKVITTVLLDADGVVQTTGEAFVSDIEALCPDPSQSKTFLKDVFIAEKPCLNGQSDFPTALAQVLSKWEIDLPLSSALDLWNQIRPVPGIMKAVQNLRHQGIHVSLASNQQAHRAGIMAAGLGYENLFEDLFFSCRLGVSKPDSNFFRKILKHMDASGENVLFIDDHPQNVAAAEDVGIFGEVYHIERGLEQFTTILERYGLSIA